MEIIQTEEIVANTCWPFRNVVKEHEHRQRTGFQTNPSLPKELEGRTLVVNQLCRHQEFTQCNG